MEIDFERVWRELEEEALALNKSAECSRCGQVVGGLLAIDPYSKEGRKIIIERLVQEQIDEMIRDAKMTVLGREKYEDED